MSEDNTLLLIDSEFPFDKIKEQLNNHKSCKIISFDFISHKKLQSLDLSHEISDNFLNDEELNKIQHEVYSFGKWYNNSELEKYLSYSNVNIGGLFHEQFTVFLSPFLKFFYEIKNIIKQFPNHMVVCSSMISKFVKIFCNNVTVIDNEKLHEPDFAHDKIRFNLKIGRKYFIFLIPRKYYKKIKEISEFFIDLFFGFNSKNLKNNNSTLLVEFNTIRFEELFLNFKNSSILPLNYARRRPSIWNWKSFSIIKKSGIKVVTSKFMNKINNTSNNYDQSEFISNLNLLFDNDMMMSKFFTIGNNSFWSIIKPIWKNLIFSRINEIIFEINMAKYFITNNKINSIIVFSEVGMTEQIIVSLSQKYSIPTFLLQVGLHWDTPEAHEMNTAQTVYPVKSDKFLVWGKTSQNDAITNGLLKPENVIPIGSPRYDGLFETENVDEDYILFAVTGPRKMNVRDLKISTYLNHENSIEQICKIVSKLGKKLIIKLHPGSDEYNITEFVKSINPEIEVITTGDILPLIKSCSAMIVTRLSTAMLECQILKKPVIYVPIFDENFGTPEIFKSNSCVFSSLDKLEFDLNKLQTDSNFKQNIINSANIFIKNYFNNTNHASNSLVEFLKL